MLAVGFFVGAGTIKWPLKRRRAAYLAHVAIPNGICASVQKRYPRLSSEDPDRVMHALRDWFGLCLAAGKRRIAMPSQVADHAWHEFILYTRGYQLFCRNALGRFAHNTPAEAMRSPTEAQEGIRRAWRLARARDGINPTQPSRLPLLFALDAALAISGGFRCALNCELARAGGDAAVYCGSHIGCSSGGGDGGCSSDSGCSGNGGGGGCGGGD